MSTVGEKVYAALTGDAGVAALVAARVYPLLLPQYPAAPAITYSRISNSEQNGTSTLRTSRWQIDCWAETYSGAQNLAAAVKAALEEYSDVGSTPGIKLARIANELDDHDPDTKQYRTIIDVFLETYGD